MSIRFFAIAIVVLASAGACASTSVTSTAPSPTTPPESGYRCLTFRDAIDALRWSPDGEWLLVGAWKPFEPSTLWRVEPATGEVTLLASDDTLSTDIIDAGDDGAAYVLGGAGVIARVTEPERLVEQATATFGGKNGLTAMATAMAWTRQGWLFYVPLDDRDAALLLTGQDGRDPKELLSLAAGVESEVWSSADGRETVITTTADVDTGTTLTLLRDGRSLDITPTSGRKRWSPSLSPDGREVVYADELTGHASASSLDTGVVRDLGYAADVIEVSEQAEVATATALVGGGSELCTQPWQPA